MAKKFIVTPIGNAVFPHLETPDTFKGATKYKVSLEVTKAEMEAFRDELNELIKDEKFETKKPKLPIKEGKEEGLWLIVASSQYKPVVFDSHKKPLPDGVRVGGGSKIRLAAEVYNYGDGASLRLRQVQVIELRERGGSTDCPFDEIEDGYTAEADEAELSAFDL